MDFLKIYSNVEKRKRKSLTLFGFEMDMLCNARRLWFCEIRSKNRKKGKIKAKVQKEKINIGWKKIEIPNLCIDFERAGS